VKHIAILLVIVMSAAAFAADETPAKSAQQAYEAKQWSLAADLYGKLTQTEPKNPLYWYRLGEASRQTGDLSRAESAFLQAVQTGFQPMLVRLGLAAVYARSGSSDKALEIIESLARNGVPAASLIEQEPAFKALTAQPRYVTAIESMKERAAPCRYPDRHPQYRQLDFWVGDWDVYGKGGALAGHSHVELILADCVVNENWTDFAGNSGKSYNTYNPSLKRWEQYWVDQFGSTTFYTGNLEGPNMVYRADSFGPSGTPQQLRLTFSPLAPDKVRQVGESSTDGGKTWTTSYDLTYICHK